MSRLLVTTNSPPPISSYILKRIKQHFLFVLILKHVYLPPKLWEVREVRCSVCFLRFLTQFTFWRVSEKPLRASVSSRVKRELIVVIMSVEL